MKHRHTILIAVTATAMLLHCSTDTSLSSNTGGGGTETTNGAVISGVVTAARTDTHSRATVHVMPVSHLPDTATTQAREDPVHYDTLSDSGGRFTMYIRDSGSYVISAYLGDSLTCADTIEITGLYDTIDVDTLRCVPGATLHGILNGVAPDSIAVSYVRVYGLDLVRRFSGAGPYSLHPLAPGVWTVDIITRLRSAAVRRSRKTSASLAAATTHTDTFHMYDITSGLAAYWPMDHLRRDTLFDRAGGHEGYTRSVTLEKGKIGNALSFADTSAIVHITSPYTPSAAGTFSCWLRIPGFSATPVTRILSSDTSCFEVSIRDSGLCNELFACDKEYLQNDTPLPTNRWVHIACTWNSLTDTSRIYIDGVQTAAGQFANDAVDSALLTFGNTTIHQNEPFTGLLDDMRLYDRVLTSAQIDALARTMH